MMDDAELLSLMRNLESDRVERKSSVTKAIRQNICALAKDLSFDLQPMESATLEDLDLELFRRIYLPSAVSFQYLRS